MQHLQYLWSHTCIDSFLHHRLHYITDLEWWSSFCDCVTVHLSTASRSNEYIVSTDIICKLHQCQKRQIHTFLVAHPIVYTPGLLWERDFHFKCINQLPFRPKDTYTTTPAGLLDHDSPTAERLSCDCTYQSDSWCVSTERERERIRNQLTPYIFFQVTY